MIDKSHEEKVLGSGRINIKRLTDANITEVATDEISAIQFDKSGKAILVASNDRYIRLFNIDGDRNEKILSVQFKEMIIRSSFFIQSNDTTSSSSEIIIGGRKPYYYSYDITHGTITKIPGINSFQVKSFENMIVSPNSTTMIVASSNGTSHVIDTRHKSWICDLKMNSQVKAISYLDETLVLTSSLDANVYLWDLRFSGKCVSRFVHDDGTPTHAISGFPIQKSSLINYSSMNSETMTQYKQNTKTLSRSNSYTSQYQLAIGAESGVVSLYNGICSLQDSKELLLKTRYSYQHDKQKSLMNLVNPITCLKYHPSGEILAMASQGQQNQLRLIHIPTQTIFHNWPTEKTPLHTVTCFDFSRGGAYFAIGNKRGKVLLYQLKHFQEA